MRKGTKRRVWALINPLVHALEGATIAPRDKLDKLRLTEYSALDSITKGHGTIQDWHTLTQVLNLSETMARHGIDRKSTRLNSSHVSESRMPSSA